MKPQQTLTPPPPGDADACLAKALAELNRDRKAVAEIQRSLLPAALPQIPGFEMSPYYRPSQQASGDYFDVVPLIDDQWGFVMADVSGHGIPAAVIMTVMRTLIHAELPSNRDKSAGEFLEHVNRVMSETYLRDGRFVTVWAAVLDPASGRLTYASAGHHPPRLQRAGDVLELTGTGGIPLGIDPAATYEGVAITFEPLDLLVIYTDGITEAMRPGIDGHELFGTERLDRVLSECGSDSTSDCTKRVTGAIAAFTSDAAPSDDQTMLILRANASRIPRRPSAAHSRRALTTKTLTWFDQEETTYEYGHEQRRYADLFQGLGSSKRAADCVPSWLAAERRRLGRADALLCRQRISGRRA